MKDTFCPSCGQELTGVIISTFAQEGAFVVIVSNESNDCNWVRCKGCAKIRCRRCYANERSYCCDEDRIVTRERVRAATNGHGSFAKLMISSADALKRLREVINNQKRRKE
jgi:hypothetical protein